MRRRRLLAAAIFTVLALTAFASGAAVVVASKGSARSAISPAQTVSVECDSPALGGALPTLVYLPAGYRSTSPPYRVIYFLHGLPAGPTSYTANAFVAASVAASGRQAIVVAPQGARDQGSDPEYLDLEAAQDWPAAISHDLPHCIDKRFHTIRSRFGRALVGLSAGGYGAFNIGLRNLSTFGVVESWSGYFAATDPSGDHLLNLGSAQANSDARVPSGTGLAGALKTWPALIAFYVGAQDTRFLEMNKQYDAALTKSGVAHVFRIYPGGHTSTLWHARAPHWLAVALDSLSSEASHRRG